jgi:hypothetical protein
MNLKKSPWKFDGIERMKDFSNASFPPDLIKVMTLAMSSALATLPHPVSSGQVQIGGIGCRQWGQEYAFELTSRPQDLHLTKAIAVRRHGARSKLATPSGVKRNLYLSEIPWFVSTETRQTGESPLSSTLSIVTPVTSKSRFFELGF